jgi:hypothetical protein
LGEAVRKIQFTYNQKGAAAMQAPILRRGNSRNSKGTSYHFLFVRDLVDHPGKFPTHTLPGIFAGQAKYPMQFGFCRAIAEGSGPDLEF